MLGSPPLAQTGIIVAAKKSLDIGSGA